MTTVQLNAKKLEIISGLMNIDDEKTVTKLWKAVRKAEAVPFERIPGLAYTREERIAAAQEGLEDIRAGRTFTTEEVFKPYEQWL